MKPSLSTPLHRSLFALPLLAIALAAAAHEPPSLHDGLVEVLGASAECGDAARADGLLALARMPGDLGLLSRRLHCAG